MTITPKYSAGGNPKGPSVGPPIEHLITTTVQPATLKIKSDPLTATIGDSIGYAQLQLALSSLSGFAPEPGVPIKFYVEPLPIDVKISPAQPIVIIPGTPAEATLSITTKGGSTTFVIAPTTLPHGLTIGYPSGVDGKIEIGEGTTSTPITINAAFDKQSTSPRPVTVKLNWTAYGGASKSTIDFDVTVLQSALIFASGNLDAEGVGVNLSGSAVWTLYSNGSFNYTGEVHTDDVLVDKFVFLAYSEYIPTQNGNTTAYGPAAYGKARKANWNSDQTDPQITELWPNFCSHGAGFKLRAVALGEEILAVIVGVALATYFVILGALIAAGAL